MATLKELLYLQTILPHFSYSPIVPSGPPQDFQVNITGSRTVKLSWSAPIEEDQNGIITSYSLSCQPEFNGLPAVLGNPGSYSFTGLTPVTEYNCTVYASTAVGDGPSMITSFTMPEDGNFHLIPASISVL